MEIINKEQAMESNGSITRDQVIQVLYPQGLPDYFHYILEKATYGYIWNNLVRQVKDPYAPREYIGIIDGILEDVLLAPLLQEQQSGWESLKAFANVCSHAYEAGQRAAANEWAGQDINVFSDAYATASTRPTRAKKQAIDGAIRIAEEHSEELAHGLGRRLRDMLRDWFETGYMSYAAGQTGTDFSKI